MNLKSVAEIELEENVWALCILAYRKKFGRIVRRDASKPFSEDNLALQGIDGGFYWIGLKDIVKVYPKVVINKNPSSR